LKSEEKYDILYDEEMSASAICVPQEKGFFGAEIYCSPYRSGVSEKDILLQRDRVHASTKYDLERSVIASVPVGASVAFGADGLCYPPQESVFRLTERALEIMYDLKNPITVITKSDLILRDAGLIATIAGRSGATVIIPVFCEDSVSEVFEPDSALPSKRFEMMTRLSSSGIRCGMMLSPIIPYITDSAAAVKRLIKRAADSGAKFIFCEPGLQLSDGQKPLFKKALDLYYPEFLRFYGTFSGNLFSVPRRAFLTEEIEEECKKSKLDLTIKNIC